MTRNLDRRIEVACPVFDKTIQKELKDMINIQLKDNVKARIIDAEQENQYIVTEPDEKYRSQSELYKYYQQKLRE
jgi:polyphosphate kinase